MLLFVDRVATVGVWMARTVRGVYTLLGDGGGGSGALGGGGGTVGRGGGGGGGMRRTAGAGGVTECGAGGVADSMRSRLESLRIRYSMSPMLAASSSQC